MATPTANWLAGLVDHPSGGVAVYSHGTPRTYATRDLVALAVRAARGLEAHGVRRGDRVALLCREGAEWIATDIAVQALGAVSVCLERAFIGELSATDHFAAVVVDTEVVAEQVLDQLGQTVAPTTFVVLDSTTADRGDLAILWSTLLGEDIDHHHVAEHRLREMAELIEPGAVATQVWHVTSFDDDGRVLGVTRRDVTHRDLLEATLAWADRLGVTARDASLSVLPLSVWDGRVATELVPLVLGCRGVIYPGLVPASLPVVRPTILVGTGPFWSAVAQSVRGRMRELEPRNEPYRPVREVFVGLAAVFALVVVGLLEGLDDVGRVVGVLCAVVAGALALAGRLAARRDTKSQEPSLAATVPGVLGIASLVASARSDVWGSFFQFCFGVAILASALVIVLGQLKWWNGRYWMGAPTRGPAGLRRRLWDGPVRGAYGLDRCRHLLASAPEPEVDDRSLLATFGLAVSDHGNAIPEGGA